MEKNKRIEKHDDYIVTQSLFDHMSAFKRIGLKTPGKELTEEIEKELLQNLKHNFNGTPVSIEPIPFNILCDEILSLAYKAKKLHPEAVVVSTVPLIAYEEKGICIEMNRLVDMGGNIISIGPRPGSQSLNQQINMVAARTKSVIIIEDGSFTGKTLQYLLNLLASHNLTVKSIVLGILFSKASEVLENDYDGEVFCWRKPTNGLVDWMPSHDFFPFIPNSGRVVGHFLGRNCYPVYLHNNVSLCMPYINPYGSPEKWASIRGDARELGRFSTKCLELARMIFEEMEKLNKKTITIDDLLDSYPKTSLPVGINQQEFSDSKESVDSILRGDIQFLS